MQLRWGGRKKERGRGHLHYSFHLSPAISHQKCELAEPQTLWSNFIQLRINWDTKEWAKERAILQCPKKASRIRHAQKEFHCTVLPPVPTKYTLEFQIQMAHPQAKTAPSKTRQKLNIIPLLLISEHSMSTKQTSEDNRFSHTGVRLPGWVLICCGHNSTGMMLCLYFQGIVSEGILAFRNHGNNMPFVWLFTSYLSGSTF